MVLKAGVIVMIVEAIMDRVLVMLKMAEAVEEAVEEVVVEVVVEEELVRLHQVLVKLNLEILLELSHFGQKTVFIM
jgi:hypothetical protein